MHALHLHAAMTHAGILALVMALAVGMISTAQAQPFGRGGEREPGQILERADRNGDGTITSEEIREMRAESFERLDRNDDGTISSEDSPRAFGQRRFEQAVDRLRSTFDNDNNGAISRSEFVDGPIPIMERADTNGDGVLDESELAAARENLGEALEQRTRE